LQQFSLLRLASIAPFYALGVSVLYLWGCWPTFGLNSLEFLGVSDIVRTVAYPIASAFIFFTLGVLLFFLQEVIALWLRRGKANRLQDSAA
jgi:hypothetical protein